MKSSLILIAGLATLAACNNTPDSNSEAKREIVADTSALYNSSTLTDTAISAPGVNGVPALEVRRVEAKKTVVKSNAAVKPMPVTSTAVPVTPQPAETSVPAVTDNASSTAATPATEPEVAPAEEKKGWSNSAKGAVIGAGAGAIGGAIISKKKVKGAVIGGVIGAAGGYIIGKNKDKKDTIK